MTSSRTARPGRSPVLLAIVLALVLALPASAPAAAPAVGASPGGAGNVADAPPPQPVGGSPFDRQGMWIWYVARSEGGVLGRIIARAKRFGIGTVYIKAGDAGDAWRQFNAPLVRRLHAGGLDVCAWQFVYGARPLPEARVGAAAVRRGADCLVIDAEGQYEGRYAAADRYVRALRARIGADFPLSLAGFPYVDYHPAFPYSVFFGPGGAQYNQPQMYWKAIGTSVRAVYEHTYLFNRLWGHPIYPIGQTYDGPGSAALRRFRRYAVNYGGRPPSWWDWQETNRREWRALRWTVPGPIGGYRPIVTHPVLRRGSRGDLVVWAQEHLLGAGIGKARLPVTGIYGRLTYRAVRTFQANQGLRPDGVLGSATWRSLLRYAPVRKRWAARRARHGRGASASRLAAGASRPLSAKLPAKGYEIDPGPRP